MRHPSAPRPGRSPGLLRAVLPFAAALRQGRSRGGVFRSAKPRWLGGGLQEVMVNLEIIVVGGEAGSAEDFAQCWFKNKMLMICHRK